jgi:hypothetical protein
LLINLLPLVDNVDGDAKRNEIRNCFACMKHEQVMHAYLSRCISYIRIGKGDNYDCVGGCMPGPPNQPNHEWDADLKRLSLQRDRTNFICHQVAILFFLKSNVFFCVMGDKTSRRPNHTKEEHLSFELMVK